MRCKKLVVLMLTPMVMVNTAHSASIAEEMILHTMLEATTSVFTTLGDYSLLNPDGVTDGTAAIGKDGISWSGTYSDTSWSYGATGVFGGAPISMTYSGALSGTDGSDITVSISGMGFLDSQPLLMNGSGTWLYDSALDDYASLMFMQETKIGAASFWGWVVGAELALGVGAGVVSGLVAGGAITLGTGGAGAPAGVVAGIKTGTIVGAGATVATTTISAQVKTTLAEDQHVAPVAPPLPVGDLFHPSHQATVVADNGLLFADDMSSLYFSTGSYDAGSFSGKISSVPEPAAIWMFCIGLLGLLSIRRKSLYR